MATLQDKIIKKPKMDPKKKFLKKGPFFELMKPVPESPHQTVCFGPEPIYRDIDFVLKCLPAQCGTRGPRGPKKSSFFSKIQPVGSCIYCAAQFPQAILNL